jgi:hypothetical protein
MRQRVNYHWQRLLYRRLKLLVWVIVFVWTFAVSCDLVKAFWFVYISHLFIVAMHRKKIEILKYSLFSVTSWIYRSALLAWHFVDSCYPYKHTSLHLELHGILFSGWILCKRNVPCSLWMLGDKLHCKQAFQGQCGKFKINWMAAKLLWVTGY